MYNYLSLFHGRQQQWQSSSPSQACSQTSRKDQHLKHANQKQPPVLEASHATNWTTRPMILCSSQWFSFKTAMTSAQCWITTIRFNWLNTWHWDYLTVEEQIPWTCCIIYIHLSEKIWYRLQDHSWMWQIIVAFSDEQKQSATMLQEDKKPY